jgi:heterodisulfide reductase subunit B
VFYYVVLLAFAMGEEFEKLGFNFHKIDVLNILKKKEKIS